MDSECGLVITSSAANRIGYYRSSQRFLRDILVEFPSWAIQTKLLEADWEHSGLSIEGSEKKFYSKI